MGFKVGGQFQGFRVRIGTLAGHFGGGSGVLEDRGPTSVGAARENQLPLDMKPLCSAAGRESSPNRGAAAGKCGCKGIGSVRGDFWV